MLQHRANHKGRAQIVEVLSIPIWHSGDGPREKHKRCPRPDVTSRTCIPVQQRPCFSATGSWKRLRVPGAARGFCAHASAAPRRELGRHCLSNATCLIWPHLFYACFVVRVNDPHHLLYDSPLLKKACDRRVVSDKWLLLRKERTSWQRDARGRGRSQGPREKNCAVRGAQVRAQDDRAQCSQT